MIIKVSNFKNLPKWIRSLFIIVNFAMSNFNKFIIMELTNEQLYELQRKFKVRESCPYCGSFKQIKLEKEQFQLTSFDRSGTNLKIVGPVSYLLLVAGSCPDCGFTMLFNLKTLGVLD